MNEINFDKPCHIYFMGIGGISMSGFAHLLHEAGFTISGSDMKQSNISKQESYINRLLYLYYQIKLTYI